MESKSREMDTGLKCLLIMSRIHRLEADEGRLRHEFGTANFDDTDLMRAARSVGFKARKSRINWSRLDKTPMPAVCRMKSGKYAILAAYGRRAGETVDKALLQEPDAERARMVTAEELREELDGVVVLLASRTSLSMEAARFDFTWFIPAMVKYRKQLGEVLLASLFIQILALLTPIFFQVVMDKVIVHRGFSTLDVIALAFGATIVFESVLGGLRAYLFTHATSRIDVELGARLFRHLLSLPQSYFEARRVGDSVARVRELDTIRNFLTNSTVTALLDFLFIFVFIAAMFFYSRELTIIVLCSLPCYVVLSVMITPPLRRRLKEQFSRGAESQAFLVEAVNGVATIKSSAVEPQMGRDWDNRLAAHISASFRASQLSNVGSHAVQFISKATTVAILWFGARAVISGELTVGQLIAFNMLAGRVSQPVVRLAQLWQDFQQAGVSVKRLGDILNTPPESPGGNRGMMPDLRGEIKFESVNFRYPGEDKFALRNVSLEIAPGQKVGVVGRSGSGKSTLTKLIQRLYLPESGRAMVDGIDLALADTVWLRRQVGVVLQENLLFNRKVRENIALADPNLSMEHVMRAARLAGAHDFITELSEGYETVIGEHGANLSGGQRQRLAIARALATDPRLLIFDEATSALDYESESIVQKNMRDICRGRTTIIVSHRLTAVRECDFIVVMENGEVVERGAHAELLELENGRYARLFALQSA